MKIKDNGVYIIKNGEEIEIEKPLKQKKWYETWMKLKGFYQID